MRFPITMELQDPFDSLEIPVLQDFVSSGWENWVIDYDNPNQLELFDTSEYQKYDRFCRVIDKSNMFERIIK